MSLFSAAMVLMFTESIWKEVLGVSLWMEWELTGNSATAKLLERRPLEKGGLLPPLTEPGATLPPADGLCDETECFLVDA